MPANIPDSSQIYVCVQEQNLRVLGMQIMENFLLLKTAVYLSKMGREAAFTTVTSD